MGSDYMVREGVGGLGRWMAAAAGIVAAMLIGVGCEDGSKKQFADMQLHISGLQTQLQQAQENAASKFNLNEALRSEKNALLAQLDIAGIRPEGLKQLQERYPDQFRLLNHGNSWKEVAVRGEDSNIPPVRITDMAAIAGLFGFVQIKGVVGNGVFPSGFRETEPIYHYTMSDGTSSISFTSYGEGYMQIEGIPDVLWVAASISYPGEALVPVSGKAGSIPVLEKLKDSAALSMERNIVVFSKFRVRLASKPFIAAVANPLSKQPDDPGKLAVTYTFYRHGEHITMAIYENFAKLTDGNGTLWYAIDTSVSDQLLAAASAG
jgi:hypothetical protein